MNERQKWFQNKRFGVFTHYLANPAGNEVDKVVSSEEWNARIDGFNVPLFAQQLKETGADYFCITIGQNSGHYCSPNATYDRLTGIVPSKCSKRDLVAELSDELAKYGIDMLAYLPAGAPCAEPQAVKQLKWEDGIGGEAKECRPEKRLAEFQIMWQEIMQEWSLRWGDKVKGWWIDGCYYPKDMYDFEEGPNFKTFTQALRAGNPNAVIALNKGLDEPFIIQSDYDDYTAGEVGYKLALAIEWDDTAEGMKEKLGGRKLHVLSYLGKTWGEGSKRLPDELAIGYSKYIVDKGGIITWDIPLNLDGTIPQEYRVLFAKINQEL